MVAQIQNVGRETDVRNSERIIIILDKSKKSALGADNGQWIVYRRRKRRDHSYWNPISFIASSKAILTRVLREKGIQLTSEAQDFIDSMPGSFREWQNTSVDRAELTSKLGEKKQALQGTNVEYLRALDDVRKHQANDPTLLVSTSLIKGRIR